MYLDPFTTELTRRWLRLRVFTRFNWNNWLNHLSFLSATAAGFLALSAQAADQRSAEAWLQLERRPIYELKAAGADQSANYRLRIEYGLAQRAAGDMIGASRSFEAAIAVQPSSAAAHVFLGMTYSDMLVTWPIRPDGRRRLLPQDQQDRLASSAEEAFKIASTLNPNDRYIWLTWASRRFARGRDNPLLIPALGPEPVLAKLRKALEIDPGYPEARRALGVTLFTYVELYTFFLSWTGRSVPDWAPIDLAGVRDAYAEEATKIYRSFLSDETMGLGLRDNWKLQLLGLFLVRRRYGDALELCRDQIAAISNSSLPQRFREKWQSQLQKIVNHDGNTQADEASWEGFEACDGHLRSIRDQD